MTAQRVEEDTKSVEASNKKRRNLDGPALSVTFHGYHKSTHSFAFLSSPSRLGVRTNLLKIGTDDIAGDIVEQTDMSYGPTQRYPMTDITLLLFRQTYDGSPIIRVVSSPFIGIKRVL